MRTEVRGGVARVVLDRPEKLNALAGPMREELLAAVRAAAADPDVRVLAVAGAGRAFCAGGDLDAMVAAKAAGEGPEGVVARMAVGADVVRAIRAAPQPVVALVHGVAAGAGAALACACDLVWADPDARFVFPWAGLGLHPDWGASWTLPRRVGPARALEWCLAGDPVGADAGLAAGLVDRIVPAGAWDGRLDELARRGPVLGRRLKENLASAAARSLDAALEAEAAAQAACWDTDACRDALQAAGARRRGG